MKKTRYTFVSTAIFLLCAQAASASSFPVSRFLIDGNTLLAANELLPQLTSLTGPARSLDDLLEARNRIEATYRDAGYRLISVGLPRSIDADGTVRLHIRELALSEVNVTPAGTETERYRAALPSLRVGTPPNLMQMSRELNLANENPSHSVTVDFSQNEHGIAAEIKADESSPLKLTLTLDNTGSRETGITRSGLIAQHANVLDLDHRVTLAYTTSPDHASDVSIVSLQYQIPLPALGDSLAFAANYSDVDSGQVADVFHVSGRGYGYGMHYVHNLNRDANHRASIDLGLGKQVYRDVVDFSGFDLGTRVATRPMSLQFNASGQSERNSYAATLGMVRNLPGDGMNNDAAYAAARFGASAHWTAVRGSVRWSRGFDEYGQISLRGEAQHSDQPLISGEQFGLGGSRSVRGLKERETAGDRGWMSSVEWTSPPVRALHRFAVFADFGHVDRRNNPGSPSENASSWGLGWRFAGWQGFSISVDIAAALDGAGNTKKDEHRGHLSAVWAL